jgi:hypothetical protein
MLSKVKLVVVSAGVALSLSAAAGIASAQPDTSVIVNSTCTYPQVMAALNDQDPWCCRRVQRATSSGRLAPEPRRRAAGAACADGQQVQALPALQPYMPVIFQVASTCNNY